MVDGFSFIISTFAFRDGETGDHTWPWFCQTLYRAPISTGNLTRNRKKRIFCEKKTGHGWAKKILCENSSPTRHVGYKVFHFSIPWKAGLNSTNRRINFSTFEMFLPRIRIKYKAIKGISLYWENKSKATHKIDVCWESTFI